MNKITIYLALIAVVLFSTKAEEVIEEEGNNSNQLGEPKEAPEDTFAIGDENVEETEADLKIAEEDIDVLEEVAKAAGNCGGCRAYCQRQGKHGWACYNGLCTCF